LTGWNKNVAKGSINNHHASAEFLNVPISLRSTRRERHKLDRAGLTVMQYMVVPLPFPIFLKRGAS